MKVSDWLLGVLRPMIEMVAEAERCVDTSDNFNEIIML